MQHNYHVNIVRSRVVDGQALTTESCWHISVRNMSSLWTPSPACYLPGKNYPTDGWRRTKVLLPMWCRGEHQRLLIRVTDAASIITRTRCGMTVLSASSVYLVLGSSHAMHVLFGMRYDGYRSQNLPPSGVHHFALNHSSWRRY